MWGFGGNSERIWIVELNGGLTFSLISCVKQKVLKIDYTFCSYKKYLPSLEGTAFLIMGDSCCTDVLVQFRIIECSRFGAIVEQVF